MGITLRELERGKVVPGDDANVSQWSQFNPPSWFDQEKFNRGRYFFHQNILSILFSYMVSLLNGFHLEMFLRTLLFTGQSSSPEIAGKRYFATLLHILRWYDQNITETSSVGYQSLIRVRKIHHFVRKSMRKRDKLVLLTHLDHSKSDGTFLDADDENDDKDEDGPNLYLNQYELGIVQSAFVVGVTLYAYDFGIDASREELEDYLFTWRVFGYYLGIRDEFNICFGNLDDVRAIVKEIRDAEVAPAVQAQNPQADLVARAFIQGAHERFHGPDATVSTFLSPAALISYSQRMLGLDERFEPRDLTRFDVFTIWLLKLFFIGLFYVPPFKRFINSFTSLPNVMSLIA